MRILLFFIVLFYSANRNIGFPINTGQAKRDTQNETAISGVVRRDCTYSKHFVGSNLFDGNRKICFSTDDVNLLIARRDFEMMIPRDLPQDLLDDKSVANIMRYFYYGLWLLRRIDDCNMRRTMEKAFYDTLGGFLGYYLIPVCKFSYYASRVELKTVRNVMALYQKCRSFLNTNGNGWRPPMRDPASELTCVRIEPLNINPAGAGENCEDEQKFCHDLDLGTANNGMEIVDDNMIVSLPKIELEDDNGYLSNIWLPFSRKRTYNLRSCKSAFIFVKFFRTVSNCYREKCMPQKSFDQKFRQWIVENIRVHLSDDLFYPGLGGILNVYESLRKYNRAADAIERSEGNENNDAIMSERKYDQMSLVEANSCALGEDFEPASSKLQKRQINNEGEVDFLERTFENEIPLDAEDESVDEWIRKFDESMLEDFQRKKVKKIKCKPKCKERKKKPLIPTGSEATKSAQGNAILATTDKSIGNFTTTAKINKITTTKTTTSKPTTTVKPKTTPAIKTEKQPMSEKSKGELLKCIFIAIAILLFILLLLALITFFRKYGKDGWERFKEKLKKLKEKLKSMKTSDANPKDVTSVKSVPSQVAANVADKKSKGKKSKDAAKPAAGTAADGKATKGKAANKKADKKAAKAEVKPDPKAAKKAEAKPDPKAKTDAKADKKDAKSDKKADKADKKAEKDAKKAQKEAEKAAKKAEKDAKKAEKAAKKRGGSKSGKSESDTSVSPRRRGGNQKAPPKPILGFVSRPTRVRKQRGGRLSRSRSRSRSSMSSRM